MKAKTNHTYYPVSYTHLFIIIIAILLIGLSIIGTVIRSIFGLGSRRSSDVYKRQVKYRLPET